MKKILAIALLLSAAAAHASTFADYASTQAQEDVPPGISLHETSQFLRFLSGSSEYDPGERGMSQALYVLHSAYEANRACILKNTGSNADYMKQEDIYMNYRISCGTQLSSTHSIPMFKSCMKKAETMKPVNPCSQVHAGLMRAQFFFKRMVAMNWVIFSDVFYGH